MSFLGLVEFFLKCFDVLAWPLLALVYPLCCSIRAIEANSVSDSQKLNAYWVVFSLVLLFEHMFMKLLIWLPLWQYIKLLFVCCLVITHFDGAFYIYKLLIFRCLSIDLQIVMNWFTKLKESSFKKEEFLNEVERYVKDNNGSESLHKLVDSKSEITKPYVKELKEDSSIENKEVSQAELSLTGTENSRLANKDVKEKAIRVVSDLKIQECTGAICQVSTQTDTTFNSQLDAKKHKAEYEVVKNQAETKVDQIKNSAFAAAGTKGKAVEAATGREVPKFSRKFQREWTCAPCHVKTQSQVSFDSHRRGRKHKEICEALQAKYQATVQYLATPPGQKTKGVTNTSLSCIICNVNCNSEVDMASHLNGKKHEEKMQELQQNPS